MWGGIWFQILGPKTDRAGCPNWVRVLTIKAALVLEGLMWTEQRKWDMHR